MNEISSQGPPPELADQINAAHAQAEAALRASLEHARTAGGLLIRAKELCPHGGWLPWLEANVRFSPRTAQAYMRVAREWDRLAAKSATVAHLGFREAAALLAKEPDEEEPQAAPGATWMEKARKVIENPEATYEELLWVQRTATQFAKDMAARRVAAGRELDRLYEEMPDADFDAYVRSVGSDEEARRLARTHASRLRKNGVAADGVRRIVAAVGRGMRRHWRLVLRCVCAMERKEARPEGTAHARKT